jgi:Fe-S-cluster-containing hydrogenase component 2
MSPSPSYAIDQTLCTFCGGCASLCPSLAIEIRDTASHITEQCIRCGICMQFCPVQAIALEEN